MKLFLSAACCLLSLFTTAQKKPVLKNTNTNSSKPIILLLCNDDAAFWNAGAYRHGMWVPIPNIDRVAKEGMLFTLWSTVQHNL